MRVLMRAIGACEHAAAECRDCSEYDNCHEPTRAALVEECSCPVRPPTEHLRLDRHGQMDIVHGVVSHECPLHGAPLGEPDSRAAHEGDACVLCGKLLLPWADGTVACTGGHRDQDQEKHCCHCAHFLGNGRECPVKPEAGSSDLACREMFSPRDLGACAHCGTRLVVSPGFGGSDGLGRWCRKCDPTACGMYPQFAEQRP